MQVVGQSRAGTAPEVHPNVVALGRGRFLEKSLGVAHLAHEFKQGGLVQPVEHSLVSIGGHQQVPVGIGIRVKQGEAVLAAPDHVVASVVALAVARYMGGVETAAAWLSAAVLLSMTYHLVQYECGRDQAATDFAITLTGILYLGWIGPYMLSLRDLADGLWWVLLVLPAAWLGDTGAYLIGSRFGRHPLTPRLSPKKSWEGYAGEVISGTLTGLLLGWLGGLPR